MRIERKNLRGVSLRGISLPRIDLRGGGDNPQDWAGYPLELDLPSARTLRNYTLYGNTSEDAKGVGDEVVQIADGSHNYIRELGRGGAGTITSASGLSLKNGHKYLVVIKDNGDGQINQYSLRDTVVGYSGEWIIVQGKFNASIISYGGVDTNTAFLRETYTDGVLSDTTFQILDITGTPYEDAASADEFAHRLGYADAEHLPAFPYGSSFVAPIRVGSKNLWSATDIEGIMPSYINQFLVRNYPSIAASFARCVGKKVRYYCKTEGETSGTTIGRLRGYGTGSVLLFDIFPNSTNAILITEDMARVETFIVYGSNTTNTAKVTEMMFVEEGITDTAYSPYFAPTLYPSVLSSPLHKIGDIVDYKESNGKEWHGLKERTFDGTEAWRVLGSNQYGVVFAFDEPIGARTFSDIRQLANLIIVSDGWRISTKGNAQLPDASEVGTMWYNYTATGWRFAAPAGTTVEEFSEMIKGVSAVFILATPTEVQGEPLPRLAIPKGESIVTLDTAVEPSNITARV